MEEACCAESRTNSSQTTSAKKSYPCKPKVRPDIPGLCTNPPRTHAAKKEEGSGTRSAAFPLSLLTFEASSSESETSAVPISMSQEPVLRFPDLISVQKGRLATLQSCR